jgi:hypothetical protein
VAAGNSDPRIAADLAVLSLIASMPMMLMAMSATAMP